jgi:hypothetical protein
MSVFLTAYDLASKLADAQKYDYPFTLLLGAGSSASSGIRTAGEMVESWKHQLFYNETGEHRSAALKKYDDWASEPPSIKDSAKSYQYWLRSQELKGETEYSTLFRHFYGTVKERQLHIERLCDGAISSFGYLYLAGLVASNMFDKILTTNFDDLVFDSIYKYYQIKPIVCSFDSAISTVRVHSVRPKIIKLHGDFLYDNIRNIKSEITMLEPNMEEKLLECCKDTGLIVVGYSGGDESIMAPLHHMLRHPDYLKFGLHWCCIQTRKDQKVSFSPPQRVQEWQQNYGQKVQLYGIDSFDTLMEEMFVSCNTPEPPTLEHAPKINIPFEFFMGLRQGGTATPTRRMVERMERYYVRATAPHDSIEIILNEAELKFHKGRILRTDAEALRARGDEDDAIKGFEEAAEYFKSGYEKLKAQLTSLEEMWIGDNSENVHLNYLCVLRRLSGLCIAQAKINEELKPDTEMKNIEYFTKAIDYCVKGREIFESRPEIRVKYPIYGTFSYNSLCAMSLIFKRLGNLNNDQWDILKMMVDNLKREDLSGVHRDKLENNEPDFKPLAPHVTLR